MADIVFFSIPAHGHTNPTLGVVRELVSRGHTVRYYSYGPLRSKIEDAGAKFIPCDDYDCQQHLSAKDGARLGKDLAFSTKILVDTTLALDEHICRDLTALRPDCVVADSMAVWGRLAARKLGLPLVSSTTTFAFNRYAAGVMKQSPAQLLRMLITMPRATAQVKRLQRRGYPVKNALDIIANDNDTHTIVYTSPEFQPCSETFSDKYAFVGPVLRPVETPFSKQRPTLVYLSMGTVNNDLLPLYRSCIEALGDTEHQVVLSVGEQVDSQQLGPLPKNISAFPQVDQMAVLAQTDVFLTHCGMNSVSEALYFGVPLVMLPQTPEQGGVAARAEQLGAGLRLTETTPAAIAAAVETVLTAPAYRESARRIGESFRACGGAKGAADKILAVCKEK